MNLSKFGIFGAICLVAGLTSCGNKSEQNSDTVADSAVPVVDTTLAIVNVSDSASADTASAPVADVEEEKVSLPAGVAGMATVPGWGKITFKKGGKCTVGTWEKVGKAIQFHPDEMSIDYFILDGKVYEGSYNPSSNTRTFEYQTEEGDLDDKTVKVNAKDGKTVKDFVWED